MPKVRQYRSQVSTIVARGPRARNLSLNTGLGFVFKGMNDIKEGFAIAAKRAETTAAESALVNFERAKNKMFFEPGKGYFNTQGRDAYDGAQGATAGLEDLKRQHAESLSPEAARMFGEVADRHITRGSMDIMRHAQKGARAWDVATIKAGVENALENAALFRNDDEQLKVQNELGRQGVYDAARLEGIDGEALAELLETYDSSFASNIIQSATVDSSVQGREALEKWGDRLEGPDKVKLEAKIQAKEKVEETQFRASQSVAISEKLVGQYDKFSDIQAEIAKIDDELLRDRTLTEARTRFNIREDNKSEEEAAYYDQGIDFVTGGGTVEAFKAAHAEAWEGMTSKQRNNLASGKHNITNQVLLSELLNMPSAKLAELKPADYAHQLTPGDLSKVRTAVKNAKEGKSVTIVQTAAAKTKAIAEQFFGKSRKWKGETAKKANEFLAAAQGRIEITEGLAERKLKPSEIDEVLAEFSTEIVQQRSAFGFDYLVPDVKRNIKNMPPKEVSAINRVITVRGEESTQKVLAVRDYLIENGIEVTVGNINKAYEQSTLEK